MRKTVVSILAIAGPVSTMAFAANREIKVDDRLDASADALIDMMRASDKGIPQDLLNKAKCVVVIPEMHAEMLSYSRARGLFAGISLEGATLAPDPDSNRELYRRGATNREILTGDFKTPAAAAKCERALHRDSPHRN